jgi:hypothetical protein
MIAAGRGVRMAAGAAKAAGNVEPVARLSWAQAAAWRSERHSLRERAPRERMLAIAAELCGLHAQVMSSAELTLWARLDGLEPGAVRRALWDERSLVKSWAVRGTLHLLPSAEYPTWTAMLGRYRHYLRPVWLRNFGLTIDGLEQLIAAIAEALRERDLTRRELADAVVRITGSQELGEKVAFSWGSLLKPATYRGTLCFGPSRGQNVCFTRPDRWLGALAPVDPDVAERELARRYLAAYGPAMREDMGRWFGIGPSRAAKLIAALGEEVAPVELEGKTAWLLREHVAGALAAEPQRSVRLLPGFDQYTVGASLHVDELTPTPVRARIYRPQGWSSPVLLVDGRMEGIWRHERKGRRLLVQIEPFARIPAWARKAAEVEAERLAAFLGGALELTWQA